MEILLLIAGLAVGGAGGFGVSVANSRRKTNTAASKANKLLEEANRKAQEATLAAKEQALKIAEDAKQEEKERRDRLT